MKKCGYIIFPVLIALFLAAIGVGLALLPDIVPVHYNFAGEVDRMGSKWEYLLFPVIMAVSGGIFALAARRCGKKEGKENELSEKIMLISAISEVLLFGVITLFFLWRAAHYAPGDTIPAMGEEFLRIVGMVLGVLLILLGNVMPKARRNAFFGLRTKWSMANDETWRKSQRFGGFSAVAVGFLLIVTGMFMEGWLHLLLCIAAVLLWAGVCIWMSYLYNKQTM